METLTNEQIKELIEFKNTVTKTVKDTPNDMILGDLIRKLVNQDKK